MFFEGKDYKEGLDLDPAEFYKRLETIEDPKNHLPSTGMPDTENIRACFENAIKDGYEEAMVDVIKGEHITVEFDRPTPLQIDGETFLDVTRYEVYSKGEKCKQRKKYTPAYAK